MVVKDGKADVRGSAVMSSYSAVWWYTITLLDDGGTPKLLMTLSVRRVVGEDDKMFRENCPSVVTPKG